MKAQLVAVFALAAALALMTASPALADDPVQLNGQYVADSAGVLDGSIVEVDAALNSLYEQAGIQLFVVYVDEFTNPESPIAWADATAEANGLGTDDLLLAVAVDQRQYALSVAPDAAVTAAQLDAAESAIEGELRNDKWAQAAIAGADSLGSKSQSSGGGVPLLPIMGGAVVIGVGAYAIYRVRRRGRADDSAKAAESISQGELDRRAGSALVDLDDALKTSEQELGFAVAQFGRAVTVDFEASLAEANSTVAHAFRIRQKLDDNEPETPEQKRTMTTEIIKLCEHADELLEAQADAFEQLRQLETKAPAALAETSTLIATASNRLPAVESALSSLTARYAPSALDSISENIDRARDLLSAAVESSARASTAIETQKSSEAAVAVRTAQAQLGQSIQLMDAVDSLATELQSAEGELDAAITDTVGDIVAARALPRDDTSAALEPHIVAAESALAAAQSNSTDPIASLSALGNANVALETVFMGVRDQQAAVAQAAKQLTAVLAGAQSRITTTAQFITTRRGGVGSEARTRISEADREVKQALALQISDPVTALTHARRADQLAATAYEFAQRDISQFSTGGGGSGVGRLGGGFSGGSGSAGGDLLGGLIGGLIGGSLGSRSSRSSGNPSWGGGSWGSSGSTGSRSRGSRSGGSGRSGGSSRRSGGGRSRGGRF